MFLVDTNVISSLAPSKRAKASALIDWMVKSSQHLFLSVISAAEVRSGIEKAEREGSWSKARHLTEWWDSIEYLYADRILPFDLKCAHVAGQMMDDARAHDPGFADIAIASTARVHDLTVLTRNLRHFAPLGCRTVDPFLVLPET